VLLQLPCLLTGCGVGRQQQHAVLALPALHAFVHVPLVPVLCVPKGPGFRSVLLRTHHQRGVEMAALGLLQPKVVGPLDWQQPKGQAVPVTHVLHASCSARCHTLALACLVGVVWCVYVFVAGGWCCCRDGRRTSLCPWAADKAAAHSSSETAADVRLGSHAAWRLCMTGRPPGVGDLVQGPVWLHSPRGPQEAVVCPRAHPCVCALFGFVVVLVR
jgi:hypothetical protein